MRFTGIRGYWPPSSPVIVARIWFFILAKYLQDHFKFTFKNCWPGLCPTGDPLNNDHRTDKGSRLYGVSPTRGIKSVPCGAGSMTRGFILWQNNNIGWNMAGNLCYWDPHPICLLHQRDSVSSIVVVGGSIESVCSQPLGLWALSSTSFGWREDPRDCATLHSQSVAQLIA